MSNLRKEFLNLLKTDVEFRYAVAGLLGFEEVLRRLDKHEEELVKLREDMLKAFAKHDEILLKHDEELRKLREDMIAGFKRHDEILLKYDEELKKLREDMQLGFARHDEELKKLREDTLKGFELVEKRLSNLERTVYQLQSYIERTSLTLEEEAFEVVSGKLKKMGIKVSLHRLILPDLEINMYGVTNGTCIIGEVTTRAGLRMIIELNEKVKELITKYPQFIRPKVIKALYTMWVTEEVIEEAKRSGIWILKTIKELTPLPL